MFPKEFQDRLFRDLARDARPFRRAVVSLAMGTYFCFYLHCLYLLAEVVENEKIGFVFAEFRCFSGVDGVWANGRF